MQTSKHRNRFLICAVLSLAVLTISAAAQTPSERLSQPSSNSGQLSEFEVATIKPVNPHASTIQTGVDVDPGGTVKLYGLTLKSMIEVAFDLSYWQIKGGEDWMSKQRYNVVAKPPEGIRETMPDTRHTLFGIKDERLRQMLQALLAERFQLKIHRETSTGRVYLLERSGKTLRLQPAKVVPVNASPSSNIGEIDFTGEWGLYNETMPELAKFASDYQLHRPVLDRTGLTGAFNYRSAPEDWSAHQADPVGSFLRLISELGLKLEPAKGPVEMLVIDHAELPSPN